MIVLSDGSKFFPRNAPATLEGHTKVNKNRFIPDLQECSNRELKTVPCCGKGNFEDIILCDNKRILRKECYDCTKYSEPTEPEPSTDDISE